MKNSFKYVFNLFGILVCLILSALLGCDQGETPKKLSLHDVEQQTQQASTSKKSVHLNVAVSAIISPKETFILYKNLLDYLAGKFGIPVQLVQRETYQEINELLRKEELDLAFVCSGAYVAGHDQFGMELLVAPKVYGETVYYSYIIVPKDSKVASLAELRGKKFAFTDPMSNTGKLVPTYMLAQMNKTPDNFFGSYEFTYSHDRSIQAVALKLVDGAAVDSLIWENLHATGSELTAKTKIIRKSEPFGIPPVVVSRELDPKKKAKLMEILLNMHKDEEGRKILDMLLIEEFVKINDTDYDTIREMKKWVENSAIQ